VGTLRSGSEGVEAAVPVAPLGESARTWVARFVMDNADQVRALARRKLTRNTRRVFDSEDVLSSVLRRLDQMAVRGTLRLRSEAELWPLIEAIARNTAVSKTRMIERARNFLTDDAAYANELLKRLNSCPGDDEATLLMLRMTVSLKNPQDRQLVTLVHRGASHRVIGSVFGITAEASRQRWKKVRDELCRRFAEGALDA
jgi:hypothetical protein